MVFLVAPIAEETNIVEIASQARNDRLERKAGKWLEIAALLQGKLAMTCPSHSLLKKSFTKLQILMIR